MEITSIEKQVKHQDRFSVYIDGEFAFGAAYEDILFYKLKVGEEISKERYDYIKTELLYDKAKNKAFKLTGYGLKSEKEIREKLLKDFESGICERAMDTLKSYGYIDDGHLAKAFVKEGIDLKGWGTKKIKYTLRNKGVNEEIISSALEGQQEKEEEKAAEILKKRLKGKNNLDIKEKAKHYRYLAGRGFSYDAIAYAFSAVNEYLEEEY